ncbi:MAG: hypothetical protein R3C18_03785 [Planctomycetaceae bacterium]
MTRAFDPEGPAVLLASADSVFTSLLARDWLNRGQKVKVITIGERVNGLPDDVEVIDVRQRLSFIRKAIGYFGGSIAAAVQKAFVHQHRHSFQRITGKDSVDDWEWNIFPPWLHAPVLAATALTFRPRFVFGQEAMMYGRATALCHNVPRILFPWGSDIYNAPESWWGADWFIGSGLRGIDLIVPSAVCGARHLIDRFRIDPKSVQSISWGLDVNELDSRTEFQREAVYRTWNLPTNIPIVLNARRFRRQWGSDTVLAAFIRAAKECPYSHFVIVAGPGAADTVAAANLTIAENGLHSRFTLIDRQVSVDEYNALASVANVFVSLTFRGDMRSSSVLQCAGCGGAPVIGDACEYRYMALLGFDAEFVPSRNAERVAEAIVELLKSPQRQQEMRLRNRAYLRKFENREQLFDRLYSEIEQIVARYADGSNHSS